MSSPMRISSASSNVSQLVSAARFTIVFDEVRGEISFSEMSGITSEVEVTDYFSSSKSGVTLAKQFGRTKPATVVLKRGVDADYQLWEWHQMVLAGNPSARRSCSLVLMDSMNVEKQVYRLLNAWPHKLEIGGLKAGGSEAVIATVTLVCEQIDLASNLAGTT